MSFTDLSEKRAQDDKLDLPESAPKSDLSFPLVLPELAAAVLQHLPTPILVLSSSKTTVLANDAMHSVLGIDAAVPYTDNYCREEFDGNNILYGLSLAQIGIDLVQEEDQGRTGWNALLDGLADDLKADNTPGSRLPEDSRFKQVCKSVSDSPLSESRGSIPTRNAIFDVQIATGSLEKARLTTTRNKSPGEQLRAELTISIWKLNNDHYFTLTFTNISAATASSSHIRYPKCRRSPRESDELSPTPAAPFSKSRGMLGEQHASFSVSSITNGASVDAPPLTNVQKLLRMQDSLIDAMDLPIAAMWRDESVLTINKALSRLTYQGSDGAYGNDVSKILNSFKVYTEDFQRQLTLDEFPIIVVCRSQSPQSKFRVGVIDSNQRRRLFEITVDRICDDKTGEFQAVLLVMKDVTWYTDKIKAQGEQSEQQFQLICETLPQMVWTTGPDGAHDYFSPRFCEYTGWTTEELTAMTPEKNPFHPEDLPQSLSEWNQSLSTGDPFLAEVRLRRHDGAFRWMQGRASALRDSGGNVMKWFGSYTDIHEVVEARVAAKRSREHLLNVIKHAQVTVWAINREFKLTLLEGKLMWEDKAPDFMQGALGQDVFNAFGKCQEKNHWELDKELIEKILEGEIVERTFEHQMVQGKGPWYRTRLSPLMDTTGDDHQIRRKSSSAGSTAKQAIEGLIGISVDVTEVKERELALQVQQRENIRLLSAEHAAREASKLKSQFLANMSHEIRTPIAGVIGLSELLLDTALNYEQKDYVENIQRSANGLLTVINDILDLSKVESGKLEIEEVPFSLTVLIHDVSKMLSFAAERKNLDYLSDVHASIEEGLVVIGDPGRIRQILTNLLTNSIKFTSEGSVTLAVNVVTDSSESVKIAFTVEDTGIGIPEELQSRLFKPFSQADPTTARKFGGTGLGLSICKNLVDLMGGDIKLESDIGQGTKTTFWISFPKAHVEAGDLHVIDFEPTSLQPSRTRSDLSAPRGGRDRQSISGVALQHHSSGAPFQVQFFPRNSVVSDLDIPPLRAIPAKSTTENEASLKDIDRKDVHVLVVEDNAINQTIALKTIQKLGFSANAVWNGKEALEYLLDVSARGHKLPDIILMDCQMPVLDGYRATHLIRHHNPYCSIASIRSTPIVAMTASAIQGDREKCTSAGMDDYLAKPVKGKQLEDMLLKWAVEGRKQRRLTETFNNAHGEHESICTASTSDPAEPSEDIRVSRKSIDALAAGVKPRGRTSPHHFSAQELAATLRDDRLLAASGFNWDQSREAKKPPTSALVRPSQPVTPLTFENVGYLGREREINPFDVYAVHGRECCSEESVPESMRNSPELPSTTMTPLSPRTLMRDRMESMRLEMRGRLTRNESSKTITQRQSAG